MTELYDIKSDSLKAKRELQYGFLAQLVLSVLIDMKRARPWRRVADLAVFEYERNRDRYLDDPTMQDLLLPDDSWVSTRWMLGKTGKRRIETAIIESGWYLARPIGGGILLTRDPGEIRNDSNTHAASLKSRAERISYKAVEVHKRIPDAEVKIAAIQFLPVGD